MVTKAKQITDSTTNRGEFNRAYKAYLEHKGKIRCSYCKYHDNENKTTRWFGCIRDIGEDKEPNPPSWKLTSKHPKQWMDKGIKKKIEVTSRGNEWVEFIF